MIIALFLFATTFSLLISSAKIGSFFIERVPIEICLDSDISEENETKILEILQTTSYIKSCILDTENNNIKYYIKYEQPYYPEIHGKNLHKKIKNISGVHSIHTTTIVDKLIDKGVPFFSKLARVIFITCTVFILLFFYIVIRVSLTSKKNLLQNMQLVGATNNYISEPILFQYFWSSLISGLIAMIICSIIYYISVQSDPTLIEVISLEKTYIITSVTIFFGIISIMTFARIILWRILKYKTKHY